MTSKQQFVLLPAAATNAATPRGTQTFVRVPHLVPEPKSFELKLRIFDSDARRKGKTFPFHSLKPDCIKSAKDLRRAVEDEFESELIGGKVRDIGYFDGSTKMWLRSDKDVDQLVQRIRKGSDTILWCDCARKKSHFSDDEEDRHDEMLQPKQSSSKRRRVVESDGGNKEAAIDTTISDLRKIHGQQYTSLQYRLWAEMLDVGTHDDMDVPPNVPLFTGNNGHRSSKKFSLEGAMTHLISSAITSTQGNPSSNVVQNAIQRSPKEPAGVTPTKKAGLRGTYLQQLREVHSLFEMGALTATELAQQKQQILKELERLT